MLFSARDLLYHKAMNKKVLHTLEYDKIIERLSEHCTSEAGKKQAHALMPRTDRSAVVFAQKETAAALSRLFKNGTFSFAGITDVEEYAKQLEIGVSLSTAELLKVAGLLEVAKRAKAYGAKKRDDEADDVLSGYFSQIAPLTHIYEEIRRCILSEEEIADDASSQLASIRRSIQITNARIREKLSQMLTSPTVRDYLQDAVVTMRVRGVQVAGAGHGA